MKVETVPLDRLQPHPDNPRQGDVGAISQSMERFGVYQPIVAQRSTGNILAGNHRWKAAHALGHPDIPVVWLDVDDVEATALMLADNRTSDLATYDEAVLAELLTQLTHEDMGLLGTGYDGDDLDALLADIARSALPHDAGTAPEPIEPPDDPTSVTGDVYPLGRHTLVCGDALDHATWATLTEDGLPTMVMTSPPYWVGKAYEREQTWDAVQDFIDRAAALMAEHTDPSGRIILNTGTAHVGRFFNGQAQMRLLLDDWQRAFATHGWAMRYVRCWAKRGQLPLTGPQTDIIDVHWEFIGYFYRPTSPFKGSRRVGGEGASWALDGIWEIPGDASAGGVHVAAYPIEIPWRNIMLFSDPGDTIIDPFGGAGTTLLAAERAGRTCRMAEIHPGYCDVIRHRAEQFIDP